MDGLEIAATALTSNLDCLTCECPRHLLGTTDRLYPIRDTDALRKAVEKARAELLKPLQEWPRTIRSEVSFQNSTHFGL